MVYNILADEDYYSTTTYLKEGTAKNTELITLMTYIKDLSQTWKIPVWYGWDDRVEPQDVVTFHSELPSSLKEYYACWLDEEFISGMSDLKDLMDDDFMVVTEWYQQTDMASISQKFETQMVVTGYEGATGGNDYLENIPPFLDKIKGEDRTVAVWMYYDINDGANEEYAAYFPSDSLEFPDVWGNYNTE